MAQKFDHKLMKNAVLRDYEKLNTIYRSMESKYQLGLLDSHDLMVLSALAILLQCQRDYMDVLTEMGKLRKNSSSEELAFVMRRSEECFKKMGQATIVVGSFVNSFED